MVFNAVSAVIQCSVVVLLLAVLFNTYSFMNETRDQVSQVSESIQELGAAVKHIENSLLNASMRQMPTGKKVPAVVVMKDFQEHKDNKDKWFSPPMYTHHHGYKICLKVFADGRGLGEGTHVTATVNFMRGEYDDFLTWPFRGIISIQLIDQIGRNHRSVNVPYTDEADSDVSGRVLEGDVAEYGLGAPYLIDHSELKPNYLQGDALHFQIHKVGIVFT